jgi:hypothetical protein
MGRGKGKGERGKGKGGSWRAFLEIYWGFILEFYPGVSSWKFVLEFCLGILF